MDFKTGLLAICLTALLGSFAMGCANKCGDLQDVCDKCGDEFTKSLCQAVVDGDDADSCDKAITDYQSAGCE